MVHLKWRKIIEIFSALIIIITERKWKILTRWSIWWWKKIQKKKLNEAELEKKIVWKNFLKDDIPVRERERERTKKTELHKTWWNYQPKKTFFISLRVKWLIDFFGLLGSKKKHFIIIIVVIGVNNFIFHFALLGAKVLTFFSLFHSFTILTDWLIWIFFWISV